MHLAAIHVDSDCLPMHAASAHSPQSQHLHVHSSFSKPSSASHWVLLLLLITILQQTRTTTESCSSSHYCNSVSSSLYLALTQNESSGQWYKFRDYPVSLLQHFSVLCVSTFPHLPASQLPTTLGCTSAENQKATELSEKLQWKVSLVKTACFHEKNRDILRKTVLSLLKERMVR